MLSDKRAVVSSTLLLGLWVLLWNWEVLLGGQIWSFHDLLHHHYPWRAWAAQVWAGGEVPLWAPVAHGYPILADGQAGLLYPPDLILYQLLPTPTAFKWSIVLHQLWAGLGAMALARANERSESAALFAGVAYAFSGFLVSHLLYLPMFQIAAWIPWMLACGLRGVRFGGRWWGALGLAMGSVWLCGHPQLALYGCYATFFVVLFQGIAARKGWGPILGLAFASAVGVGIAFPQLLASWELSELGSRGARLSRDMATMGSLPLEEIFNGVFPYNLGYERPADIGIAYHHRGGAYLGRGVSYWESCFYLGIPTALAMLGAGWTKRGRQWWVLLVVSLLFMLGSITPVCWLLSWLPGVGWFRFPLRAGVLVAIAASQLAALGCDRWAGRLRVQPERATTLAKWIVGGLGVLMALVSVIWVALGVLRDHLQQMLARFVDAERATALVDQLILDVTPWTPQLVWPGILLLAIAACLLFVARRRLDVTAAGRLLAVILAVDLFIFGFDFNPTVPNSTVTDRPEASEPLLGLGGQFRTTVLDRRVDARLNRWLLSSNLGLAWGLEDVIVPSPLRTKRNEDYLAAVGLDLGLTEGDDQVAAFVKNRHLADLSGLRFVYSTKTLEVEDLELFWSKEVKLGHDTQTVNLYENKRALPRAFAVGCTVSTDDGQSPLSKLVATREIDRIAVVEGPGLTGCEPGSAGEVTLSRPKTTVWEMDVTMERAGWLVLTESAYPGQVWTVDGQRVGARLTNYLFSGLALPAGEHKVTMHYLPIHLYLALGFAALLFGVVLGWVVRGRPPLIPEVQTIKTRLPAES
ncbi:MAG: hypothetical protein HN348_07290 [Proteobacteria bacterium]|nr:hypothetical protein [Pseudomonadota bacterium]